MFVFLLFWALVDIIARLLTAIAFDLVQVLVVPVVFTLFLERDCVDSRSFKSSASTLIIEIFALALPTGAFP